MRLLMLGLAGFGLAGCVAYTEPLGYVPPPRPVYVAPPPVYVAPRPPRRVWVPRRCDRWGRCWGGYWR